VIDATGEALDTVRPYTLRDDFVVQGLTIDAIIERIPEATTVVGIGCMFSSSWPITRLVAENVRARFTDALIVAGGEHITALPEFILGDSPVDVAVLGEGEETFLALLDAWDTGQPLADVPGLAFRHEGRVINTGLSPRTRHIDSIPLPDWDSFPIEEYISRHQSNGPNLGRSMPILTTRGCPYRCTFCSNDNMWTTRYVQHSPKRVVDEMALYAHKYHVTNFDCQDLTAIVKRSWSIQLCKELIARGLNITWQMPTGTRSEVFDDEVVDLLYQSGCRLLSFAPESGSPEILRDVKKQIDLENLFKSIRRALRAGFKVSCFIVIGFPTERPDTLKVTMRLIRKFAVMGVHDITVSKFVPYPGSVMFRELLAEGKVQLNDEFFFSPMDLYTKNSPSYADAVSLKFLYRTMLLMFFNFYIISFLLRPFRVIRVLWRAITTGVEETKYAKWFIYQFYSRRKWRQSLATSPSDGVSS
jgi:radical SAM superfamily enzyme YgiQ (UPF0313 family)